MRRDNIFSLFNPLNFKSFLGALAFFTYVVPQSPASSLAPNNPWDLEPLFGSDAWNNAGLLAPTFEEDELSIPAAAPQPSPLFELEKAPLVAALGSLENVPTQDPFASRRPQKAPRRDIGPNPKNTLQKTKKQTMHRCGRRRKNLYKGPRSVFSRRQRRSGKGS